MFAKQALERGPPLVVLDGGDWSFDFYMETKNVAVALDTHAARSWEAEPSLFTTCRSSSMS